MIRALLLLAGGALILTGCSGSPKQAAGGGYYKDDGPGSHVPANIAAIPDAVPRIETPATANLRPYAVFGRRYTPIGADQPLRQEGIASWYGRKFHGRKTANGERYDMYAMTAAHPTLPLPSYARVTHARNGQSIIVRINDRGPFHSGRIIDLSYVAAAKLGLIGPGSGPVIVEAITNTEIRSAAGPGKPVATQAAVLATAPVADPLAGLINRTHAADSVREQAGYFLQFGAFSAHDNALALARRLNHELAGMDTPPAAISSTADLYRVRMGPYPSRQQALDAAARIQDSTGRRASFIRHDGKDTLVRQAASL
ncbi:MAG: septal ring lytic transglycosylase RlpA family protein [Castellaniella sp.]